MSILLQTSFGDITIDLFIDKCPNACLNFIKLCLIKHYNNALFAQVQHNYLTKIKTKQPTTIWKQCGESNRNYFKDQIDLQSRMNKLGLVATANHGVNLNNSQFFITLTKAHLESLNSKHTVFGQVQEGFDVLKKINDTFVDKNNRPQMNIRILHTFVLEDPFQSEFKLLKIPQSPKLEKDTDRLQAIEHFEMLGKNKTQKDIIEATKEQKAKKQAVTLEMIGDLPDADIKPPQNILFICKLNPITQERDLQIIFSRFGPIKSVEIVRDWKTGQSLQYGFVEFENPSSCEEAYLKMQNVVIDDKRIHVDFSQSVSKLLPKNRNIKQNKNHKSGQMRQKMKDLIPKVKDGKNFYGDTKYDIIINHSKVNKEQLQNRQKISKQESRKYQNQKKHKKRSYSQSSSQERHKKHKKNKKQQRY